MNPIHGKWKLLQKELLLGHLILILRLEDSDKDYKKKIFFKYYQTIKFYFKNLNSLFMALIKNYLCCNNTIWNDF